MNPEEKDEQLINDLDLVVKLLVPRSNNLHSEIYYPNFRQNPQFLKNVIIKVKTINHDQKNSSLCENLLGIYPGLAYDIETGRNRLIVQGFLPKMFTYKHKNQLRSGDLLISINNVYIDSENIEGLLSEVNPNDSLKITAISSLNYPAKRNEQKQTAIIGKTIAASKSTQVILGDRVKSSDNSNSNPEDVSYLIMVLSFDRNNQKNDSDEMKDVIYKYPRNENEINRKLFNLNELMNTIRGLFITLAYAIKDIDRNDEAVCCMIEHQDQLYHVCFLHENYSKSGILILIIPFEQISLNYLKILANNLNKTFQFTFGDLFNRLINVEHRINETEKEKINSELDEFFSQLKSRFFQNQSTLSTYLNRTSTSTLIQHQQQQLQRKQESTRRMHLLIEMRYKFFDSIPFLDLPHALKCDIDLALSGLEAQEFVDLENNFYLNRRLFTLNGSCLFYKDYLIASHLNSFQMINIYNFCEHYGLFNLMRNGCINQTIIWKEVYIPMQSIKNRKVNSNCRHFLVIVALKEFLLGVIYESGGVIARQIDTNKLIEPNPFYIQQVTYALNDLYESGLMSEINRYFNFSSGRQIVFNINKFLRVKLPKQKQQQIIAKQRENSKSRSPNRGSIKSADHFNDQTKQKTASINLVENVKIADLETNNELVYQAHKEYRHKSPIGISRTYLNDNESIRYFSDVSLNDSVIYYASDTNNTNGIIFSPKRYDFGSNLFIRVFSNYIQSCFKIKNLFDISLKNIKKDTTDKNDLLIEQGVLFSLLLTEDTSLNKTSSEKSEQNQASLISSFVAPCSVKAKELNFWVVGRRRMKRTAAESTWKNLGDFYICYHDSADQILLELAFDIGFCKIST